MNEAQQEMAMLIGRYDHESVLGSNRLHSYPPVDLLATGTAERGVRVPRR